MSEPAEVQAAYALLMAAMLNRDIVDAMPRGAYASMPGDIRRRLESHIYQTAFDGLPEDVRMEAELLAYGDPDVVEARRIHARG
jgi:hypothetical protein